MKRPVLSDLQLGDLTHALAMLLHSGISVSEGLYLLAREEEGRMKQLLEELGASVDHGSSLCAAMEESGAFSRYVCGMVRIGEDTGRLEDALNSLSGYCRERCRVSLRLRSAITYPGTILLLMLAVIGVLLVQVLPVFDRVYATLGTGLTGIAGGLLAFGQLLSRALPFLLVLVLLLVIAAGAILLCPPLRSRGSRWVKRRFGDRWLARRFNNARFARGLAMGLRSGLMMEEALELACSLLSDVPDAQARGRACANALSGGTALPDAMAQAELLPAASSRMLAVGIRSGNADRVMEEIADTLHEEAADALDRVIARIEPAMVLTASVLVGLILLAVMLPLMNIMSALG